MRHLHTGFDSFLLDFGLGLLCGAQLQLIIIGPIHQVLGGIPWFLSGFSSSLSMWEPRSGCSLVSTFPTVSPTSIWTLLQLQCCQGCPQAQGTWDFSLAKPACQGSWLINISLHTQSWHIFSSGKGGGGFPTAISAHSSSPRGAEWLGQAGPAHQG